MAQIKLIIANLFLSMILFSRIIRSIEGRYLKFENANDPSTPYVHTVALTKRETEKMKQYNGNMQVYATEKALIDNVATLATPLAPTPPSPVQIVSQPPPPGHADGFTPSGPGHSPGIGHSLKGN
uniref:Uncharacterized protein n=1 Tax=Nicotiana tabacum TaxID=4097 RepID=A0A1S3XS28_TOBAC|nr:PREDICTED: uncharacterized protein LOC107768089 [Nicotiana tabacum]